MTKQFKVLKNQLQLSPMHTMYSLRHTFISNLFQNGATSYELMSLTGHTTLAAFEKYIRSIRDKTPIDVGAKLTISI